MRENLIEEGPENAFILKLSTDPPPTCILKVLNYLPTPTHMYTLRIVCNHSFGLASDRGPALGVFLVQSSHTLPWRQSTSTTQIRITVVLYCGFKQTSHVAVYVALVEVHSSCSCKRGPVRPNSEMHTGIDCEF